MIDLTVDAGSARLRASEWPAEGTVAGTVVALHAGVADRRSWSAGAERWAMNGWRVIAHDRRGFGASEWEEGPHDDVLDLLAVMDDREVPRAALVGNSMGGALAIDAALARPERVGALVLVASAVSGRTDLLAPTSEVERRLEDEIEAADAAGDVDLVNRLECHYWLDGPGAAEGRVGGAARELFLDMNGIALRAPPTGEPASRPGAWDRLGSVSVPTLVVSGTLDERDTCAVSRHLGDEIPGADVVELPGSAHLPSLDAPETLADLVLDFLRRIGPELGSDRHAQ